MSADPDASPLSELRSRSALARAVGASVREAMIEKRDRIGLPSDASVVPEGDGAATNFGNVRDVLENGPRTEDERTLLSALLAVDATRLDADRAEAARMLVWATANTELFPLSTADDVLDEKQRTALWDAVGQVIRQDDPGALDRADRCIAALALASSRSEAAAAVRRTLLDQVTEMPIRKALVGPARPSSSSTAEPDPGDTYLQGEMSWAPGGPFRTAVYAVTGVLFVRSAGSLLLRYAFGFRRPARLRLTSEGVELAYRVDLLGRTLREHASVVPLASIAAMNREVRFSRAGTYSGLVALVLGTYVGVTLVADGFRAPGGSPTLVGLGLAIIAIGLVLDFGLTSLLDGIRNTVRLVVVPERGRRLCVSGLDASDADTLLRQLSGPAQ